jgi:hypothetical protein
VFIVMICKIVEVYIPIRKNRNIQVNATLFSKNGTRLLEFVVRAHGHSLPNGEQVNQFSHDGATPTGLTEFDLNSREPSVRWYGPYPVLRAVKGLQGNSVFCMSNTNDTIRTGILMHTFSIVSCRFYTLHTLSHTQYLF